jgi:predicted permease
VKRILKKFLLFPPATALIIGLIVKIIFQPENMTDAFSWVPVTANILEGTLEGLQWIALLSSLLVVGLTFDLRISSLEGMLIKPFTVIRLIIAPFSGVLVLGFLCYLFDVPLSQVEIIPILIQAIAGPAVINIAFSEQFGLNTNAASVYITLITFIALIWLIPVLLLSFILIPV